MEKYKGYKAEDFLMDDSFVQWLRAGNAEVDQRWEQWLELHPEALPDVRKARLIYQSMHFKNIKLSSLQIEKEWERLVPELNESHRESLGQGTPSIGLGAWWWKVAGIFLILGLVYLGQYQYPTLLDVPTFSVNSVKAEPGNMVTVTLPDGSRVKLNGGSELKYQPSFAGSTRKVQLTGEAFFDVQKDSLRPFIIQTGLLMTEVLGTSFAIRAYGEQESIEVAVVEGKVRLHGRKPSKAQKEVVLVKDEMATFDLQSKEISVGAYDPSDQIAWKDGVILFKKADFSSIVKKLEKRYGIKFRVNGNVQIDKDWRFTGKFTNKSVEYILEAISYPNVFKYRVDNKTVNIYH
ncbi:ferric-dicitrate binding protein FerR (iron transport regulator) [Dyadobacter jejuensis]|uniref:Ferric-dicitrate binding protein FerR (Iron transport regulator) n=1 Tax=Dyadobacter jejuensis TaxID=1082580 RepID=A0A316AHY2_9BACT|nr:FecR family protein [Dyadobacter jejuensis]PWJ56859.1 ferric-dicitrate binding protein FerR (iron transport regulator) [Dyadobacter jejuensis]